MKRALAVALLGLAAAAHAERVPLPEARVRLLVNDPAALDAALSGRFREVLAGQVPESDPLVQAWRSTQVGSKLEAQWAAFSENLGIDWSVLMALRPSALGLAVLDAGHLEAVLVVETALAELPLPLPEASAGREEEHAGIRYLVVRRGAADGSEDPDRRMGLAIARPAGRLIVTTSVRAMRATLDALVAGRGMAPAMEGMAYLELDGEALREDFYFRREYLFGADRAAGTIRAVLRQEGGRLVEVRRGEAGEEPEPEAARFDIPGAWASGWENEPGSFGPALRGALLEPVPDLPARPVRRVVPLPPAREASVDTYAIDFKKHGLGGGEARYEEGDLAGWAKLLTETPVAGWGYAILPGGRPVIVFEWPEERARDLEQLCRATVERRAGSCTIEQRGGATVFLVGPALPALAMRRTGPYLWIGPDEASLAGLPAPQPERGLRRWATLSLQALRSLGDGWERAEDAVHGVDGVKPLTDRIQGLAQWMPAVSDLTVERRQDGQGWEEVVTFGTGGASPGPR